MSGRKLADARRLRVRVVDATVNSSGRAWHHHDIRVLRASSVGTKILIGITGLALFVYLLIHIAGNLLVFFGPDVFNTYAYTLEGNPLLPVIEIGLLLIFLIHIYKTVTMFLGNQAARPVRYVKKKSRRLTRAARRFASSTMILSGPLAARVPRHPRQGVPLRRLSIAWPAGGRDLYRTEMENLRNPLMVGFYVLQHARRRLAPVARHRRAPSSRSALDHPRWTPRLLRRRARCSPSLIAGGFIVIAALGALRRRAGDGHEARREDSRRARSPKSGTGTSSR